MRDSSFALFRDLDGAYALVRVLDNARARVHASNVLPRDEKLWVPVENSWDSSTEDLGGFTRVSPHELVPEDDGAVDAMEDESETDDDILHEAHEKVEARSRWWEWPR